MNIPGVYRIVNTVSDTTYIGSSFNMRERLINHIWHLRRGRHINRHLQSAWNKYGQQAFSFEPLIGCVEMDLGVKEQQFIDAHVEHGLKLYNINPSAKSRIGFHCVVSMDTRQKQSVSQKKRFSDPSARAQIGLSKKGKVASVETKAKLSQIHKTRVRSQEEQAKRIAASTGRIKTLDERMKLSAARTGWRWSQGIKDRLSEKAKIRMSSQERRAHLRMLNTGKKASPETKAKMSAARTGMRQSPETRAKRIATMHLRQFSGSIPNVLR